MRFLHRPEPPQPPPVSLALQGGGAHGAFQWGVLDALLEAGGFDIQAITGASAGAMNAVALACGMAEAGPQGARERLQAFWRAVSQAGRGVFGDNPVADLAAGWFANNPAIKYMEAFSAPLSVSPYDFNPLNLNPLRDVLKAQIDFGRLRAPGAIALHIAATAVRRGEARLFGNAELTAEHVMASACLPDVFQAVEIDGEAYWDGGYLANPPIWPLVEARPRDVVLCLLNPLKTARTPRSHGEILNRLNELSFNASVQAELRAIAMVHDLIGKGALKPAQGHQPLRFHLIAADGRLDDLKLATKFNTDWGFLQDLKARGREAGRDWLQSGAAAVGERPGIDLAEAFL